MTPAFAALWWRIGTVMNWQARMQPALAVLAEEYRRVIGVPTPTKIEIG
jgi:hypothetical protein